MFYAINWNKITKLPQFDDIAITVDGYFFISDTSRCVRMHTFCSNGTYIVINEIDGSITYNYIDNRHETVHIKYGVVHPRKGITRHFEQWVARSDGEYYTRSEQGVVRGDELYICRGNVKYWCPLIGVCFVNNSPVTIWEKYVGATDSDEVMAKNLYIDTQSTFCVYSDAHIAVQRCVPDERFVTYIRQGQMVDPYVWMDDYMHLHYVRHGKQPTCIYEYNTSRYVIIGQKIIDAYTGRIIDVGWEYRRLRVLGDGRVVVWDSYSGAIIGEIIVTMPKWKSDVNFVLSNA